MGATPRAEVRAHAERALARAAPLANRLSEAARALSRLPRPAGVCALRGERPAARAGDTGRARIPPGNRIGCLSARGEATAAADELARAPRHLPRSETRPEIAVPMRRGDRRPAPIDVDRGAPAAFGASDCAFLEEPGALVEPAAP